MSVTSEQKLNETRKKLSIELCDNFTTRLDPAQSNDIKLAAIIAIGNFIKESKIDDPILFSFLVDPIVDPDKEVRDLVIRIIKKVVNPDIVELLEIKLQELNGEIKTEIKNLLQALKHNQ